MRILDLDLDFFLNKVAINHGAGEKRLNESEFTPWNHNDIVAFFERTLNLSTARKIPGAVVTHHQEVLYLWRSMIRRGILDTPFEVIHIDAHDDLGLEISWHFLFDTLLHVPVEVRSNIEKYKYMFVESFEPDCGDYLLFALAFRWIDKLTYYCHPKSCDNDDIKYIMRDFDRESKKIQLKSHVSLPANSLYYPKNRKVYLQSCQLEPEVEFSRVIYPIQLDCSGADMVTLSVSPGYTPASADFIVEVFRRYIVDINR